MRDKGFSGATYTPIPYPKDRDGVLGVELWLATNQQPPSFGIVSPAEDENPSVDPYFESLSDSEQARYGDAMFGTATEHTEVSGNTITRPADGCITFAEDLLYGGEEYFELESIRSVLYREIYQKMMSTGFQDILDDYEECMSQYGYKFAEPGDARSNVRQRLESEGPEPDIARHEVIVATHDQSCQIDIDYRHRSTTIYNKIVSDLHSEYPDLLRLNEIESTAIIRATDLLNNHH